MAKKKTSPKIYVTTYFNPDANPVASMFAHRPDALKYIKEQFASMLDTGDRLRRIRPNIYVLEPDYQNTGVRATADNYDEFHYWTLDEFG